MDGLSAWQLFILIILAVIYMLPSIVASRRAHRNTLAIVVLNTLLGWTLLGWAAALIWALIKGQAPKRGETAHV